MDNPDTPVQPNNMNLKTVYSLPVELRLGIFEPLFLDVDIHYIYVAGRLERSDQHYWMGYEPELSIFGVSPQICEEALQAAHETANFRFFVFKNSEAPFLKPQQIPGPQWDCDKMRHVDIVLHGTGDPDPQQTHDLFVNLQELLRRASGFQNARRVKIIMNWYQAPDAESEFLMNAFDGLKSQGTVEAFGIGGVQLLPWLDGKFRRTST